MNEIALNNTDELTTLALDMGRRAKKASALLAKTNKEQRSNALKIMASKVRAAKDEILSANA